MPKKNKAQKKEETKKAAKAKVERSARVEGHVDHPVHPKCPECGRAMFKWMGVNSEYANKTPKKEDPWAYCRNKACPLFGENQSESTPKKKSKKESKVEDAPKKREIEEKDLDEELEGFGADEDDVDDGDGDEDDDEIDAIDDNDEDDEGEEVVQDEDDEDDEDDVDDDEAQIAMAACRKRIVKAIRKGGKKAKDAIQLALSVLHGETSIKQVNEMIDEFDLEDEYGLKKK